MKTAGVYPYDYRYGFQVGTDTKKNPIFEFRSMFAEESMNGGHFSWSEMMEGRFLEPYDNMQSYLLPYRWLLPPPSL